MPFVTIPKDIWTEVVVTSADTIVQNRAPHALFLSTEDTTSLDLEEGLLVPPGAAVEIASGSTVMGASINVDGRVFYMEA